jgi:hypothetical protein
MKKLLICFGNNVCIDLNIYRRDRTAFCLEAGHSEPKAKNQDLKNVPSGDTPDGKMSQYYFIMNFLEIDQSPSKISFAI